MASAIEANRTEPQSTIAGLGFLGKNGNETSLMKLAGSTNRFLLTENEKQRPLRKL